MSDIDIPISLHRLDDGHGLQADVTNVGARIVRLVVDGTDVVLGFDTPEEYLPERHLGDFGAVIGRYANRIAKGRFANPSDGWDVIQLPQNNGQNCLHGGPRGWQYSIYDVAEVSSQRLVLCMVSPDGDQGFPGTVQVRVTYTLDERALRIDYHAETDSPTVINMTNHSYFNLDGTDVQGGTLGDVYGHILGIDADMYTPTDATAIPLGGHAPVEGTPFDFRHPKPIGRDIEAGHPQLKVGHGYDHNFVLRQPGLDRPSATLESPKTGIRMALYTTAPGLQLYTGNFLDGLRGKGGVAYPVRSAVCLEAQQYPDSPNRRWPESTGRLVPDRPFSSTTIFKFSHK